MSSSTDSPIPVGRVGRPHGVRGEVTVLPQTDDPARFAPGSRFTTDDGRVLVVATVSPYRDRGLIIGFSGVTDRVEAEALRGTSLTIPAGERRSLEQGEYWAEDLVGLEAITPTGTVLGRVVGVDFGEAQDRLVVDAVGGEEVLVPFVDAIVGEPGAGRIVIDAPEGLFP